MTTTETPAPTVLIVDDEPGIRDSLARHLWNAGFRCATAADGAAALILLQQSHFAVMLCDVRMPGMDGIELLPHVHECDPDLPVIMLTAFASLQMAIAATRAGAYDYITKPFQLDEVELAVRRALETAKLRAENRRYVVHLEELVEERTAHLRRIGMGVVTALALTLEAKDEWTHDHSRRVANLAAALGAQAGLPHAEVETLRLAGLLHDIGKIGVREAVLHKPEALTAEEMRHIRQHPELGAHILAPLDDLKLITPMVRHHHERWDGAGYPNGLAADDIPVGARILGVADAYTAMREDRPYRAGQTREYALRELRLGARRQFDLHVVAALLALDERHRLEALDSTFPEDLPPMFAA